MTLIAAGRKRRTQTLQSSGCDKSSFGIAQPKTPRLLIEYSRYSPGRACGTVRSEAEPWIEDFSCIVLTVVASPL
jgi:hypothetical protein